MILVIIGGKQRSFKFGFNAIDIFCRQRNISISEFNERFAQFGKGSSSVGELRDIIYAGLCGGALSTGEPISFTTYNVGDWLDELPETELAKIMEAITQSVCVKKKVTTGTPQHSLSYQERGGVRSGVPTEKIIGSKP